MSINNPKWALAGCKPQACEVLTALSQGGFVPTYIFHPNGLSTEDVTELKRCAGNVEIYESKRLDEHTDKLDSLDLLLTCRFNILKPNVFSRPKLGTVNIHSSLLPQYRGVHPVSWAIVDGAKETGVTIHSVDAGIDTGAILLQEAIPITEDATIWSLTAKLNTLSARLAIELFEHIARTHSLPKAKPQRPGGSYARRRTPEDGRIDWNKTARDHYNLVRALQDPLPAAYCLRKNGEKVRVLSCRVLPGKTRGHPGTVLRELGPHKYEVSANEGTIEITSLDTLILGEALE